MVKCARNGPRTKTGQRFWHHHIPSTLDDFRLAYLRVLGEIPTIEKEAIEIAAQETWSYWQGECGHIWRRVDQEPCPVCEQYRGWVPREYMDIAVRFLEEYAGHNGVHDHCNEDGGGNHTLDIEWWEEDVHTFLVEHGYIDDD